MTTEQSSEASGASATAAVPTSTSPAAPEHELAEGGFARDTGAASLRDYLVDYIQRVRGGEVGALPAILGLVVLGLIFTLASDRFLSVANLANLVQQSGITVFIAMGLVFVLLLGEIDLAAGTASGVCASMMGLAVTRSGDLRTALGTPTWLVVLLFLLAAIVIAAFSRLWYAVAIVAVGAVMVALHLGTSTQVGAIYVA